MVVLLLVCLDITQLLNQFEGYNNGAGVLLVEVLELREEVQMKCFLRIDQTATTSYSITANKHAHTVSPTINNGVTITVPSGAILSYLIVMPIAINGSGSITNFSRGIA